MIKKSILLFLLSVLFCHIGMAQNNNAANVPPQPKITVGKTQSATQARKNNTATKRNSTSGNKQTTSTDTSSIKSKAPASNNPIDMGNYYYGTKDYQKAASCYRMAAEQGNAVAQYCMGILCNNGEGVEQNYADAAKWFRKAGNQGYANAQYALGLQYAYGHGVIQNTEAAIKWLQKAAAQGHKDAQKTLSDWGY